MSDQTYFEDYSAANVVFFFVLRKDLNKDDPNYKVAIVYRRDEDNNILQRQYFNAKDQPATSNIFLESLNNNASILNITKQIAIKEPKSVLAKLLNKEISVKDLSEQELNQESTVLFMLQRGMDLPSSKIEEIYKKNKNNLNILIKIAKNKNTPIFILNEIFQNSSDQADYFEILYPILANNLSSSPSLLEDLAISPLSSTYVKGKIAENPNTPKKILKQLSYEEGHRSMIGNNPNLDKEMIDFLLERGIATNLEQLAANETMPAYVLEILSKHSVGTIRTAVASNNSTSAELLDQLSKDRSGIVRKLVARNKNTSIDTLKRLVNDKDFNVSSTAQDYFPSS